MRKTVFALLSVLFVLAVVFTVVACKQDEPVAAEYTVTFDSVGGSAVEPASVTVTEGSKVKKPADPKKEGYYFGGWWTKNNKGDYKAVYNFAKAVKSDLALYARWYTTEYYMPAGWVSTITTPVIWTSKDPGTVTVPDAVLQGDFKTKVTNVTPALEKALADAIADPDYFKPVKNVIIIISDGMGITHVQASEQWSGDLIMTKLPNVGVSMTKTREDAITDSAAGGTAIAEGYKTTSLFAAMDAEGNELLSVSELARSQGKLVGIVTNAEMADATPAVFSVHNKNRSEGWTKMCQQQIVFGADLFMGNGYSDYSGYFNASNDLYKFVEANNMKLYSASTAMVSHLSDDAKMWAVFAGTANKFARFDTTDTDKPNLQQMTAYALKWLDEQDKNNNDEKGFVVMIENTYTDHFGHGNQPLDGSANTYGIVKEVQSTDEAVAIALKYVLEHPDTALIVTADHETGNTTLKSGWETDFTRIVADSGSHSAQNVPVFAIGKGTEELNTLDRTEAERAAGAKWAEATPYENAIIGHVIGKLLGDENFGGDVETDTNGKTSPRFDVTVTDPSTTLTFTLDLTGVPFRSGNLIQFKIKPLNEENTVKLELLDSSKTEETWSTLFKEVKFSTAKKDAELSPAYKQALVEKSGLAKGWYQFSLPATVGAKTLRITLTGNFKAGDVIGMDDLTVQYASTIGQILFGSSNATAEGAPLVVVN